MGRRFQVNSNIKTGIFWVILACVLVLLWQVVKAAKDKPEKNITFTEFIADVQADKVKKVSISGSIDVKGAYKDNSAVLHTTIPANYPEIYKILQDKGVEIDIKEASGAGWVSVLINASPFILLLAFWIFMMRQMQSGGNKALSFGKSRARLHSTQQKKVTFKDVAGVEEAKDELQEIIEFLREPQKFQKLGGRIPKGVLLMGPPGTGKTLLARAVAGEANVPFFSISGSDFVEMFVGVGASRVRDLFEQGKKNAPCIVFIDEIDAVGRHRGAGLGGGHDEREQTLNQLLVEMDGFEFAKDKVLMGAERRSMIISEGEKRITAIHEAGHALLTVVLPQAEPIHKVTIIPRGMALGLTQQLPTDEKHNYSKEYLMDQIAILLGGRIAEEITMDSLTTGAGNDLERATELARRMVCEWGMSDAMGPLTFGKKEEQIFLGREIAQHQDYSEDTALKIDQEVKRFVTDNYQRAHRALSEYKETLVKIADALLAREVLDADQVKRLAAGLPLEEPQPVAARTAVADEDEARPRQKERTPLVALPKPLPQE